MRGSRFPGLRLLFLVAVVLLAGCAGLRQVDSDVRSFSTLQAVPAGAGYRFERLPSQQASEVQPVQARVEAAVAQALAGVGLQRSDAAPLYSVQVGVQVTEDPFYYPWGQTWPGWWGGPWRGPGFGPGFYPPGRPIYWRPMSARMETPIYRREVSLVLRELASSRVVYETHAVHDGRWADTDALLPAMFQAALAGFPQPPEGPRRVIVEIPR